MNRRRTPNDDVSRISSDLRLNAAEARAMLFWKNHRNNNRGE